jgi:hypothetical protein
MEAGQQEHRNKDKCRGDERKVNVLVTTPARTRFLVMIASWTPIGYDEPNAYGSVGANLRAIQSEIFFSHYNLASIMHAMRTAQASEQFYTDLFRRRT